jgi:predicted nucleic acid-binding protein
MSEERHPSPAEEAKRLYEESESRTARAFEQVVSRDSFGELLARVTENVVALSKIGSDVADLVLRNLRLAGRQDITALARQLARTEDKLELLLQEVERLRDEQGTSRSGRSSPANGRARSGRSASKRSRTTGGSS